MNTSIIQKLNQNLADLHILYVKLHNYHWNIQGPQFFTIHKATEEFYEHIAELYDEVAERILQLGAKPLATAKGYVENAQLKEEQPESFAAHEVANGLIHDFAHLRGEYNAILELAENNGDVATANLVSEQIQWLEKSVWMLKSSL